MLKDESKFLNKIKDICLEESIKYSILPSVLASLAITISKWGMSKEYYKTKNIYLLPADNSWNGRCYSKETDTIYLKSSESTEKDLYRVYDNYRDSIKDFVSYLIKTRRSENGPYKYQAIVECPEYSKAVNILLRAGLFDTFTKDQDSIQYASTLVAIIEKYDLYQWDSEVMESLSMSKKKHKMNQNDNNEIEIIDNEQPNIEEEINTPEHIYRVRLDWDKRDTQIFSSTSYEDCLAEAKKHEGYKIFIDDGELFKDPWLNINTPVQTIPEKTGPQPTICVVTGQPITLENTPIYKNSTDKGSMMKLSGVFYFYDNGIINGRAKITKEKSFVQKDLRYVLGYINVK